MAAASVVRSCWATEPPNMSCPGAPTICPPRDTHLQIVLNSFPKTKSIFELDLGRDRVCCVLSGWSHDWYVRSPTEHFIWIYNSYWYPSTADPVFRLDREADKSCCPLIFRLIRSSIPANPSSEWISKEEPSSGGIQWIGSTFPPDPLGSR